MSDKARSVAVMAIDNAVTQELGNQNFKYSDVVQIERTDEGKLIGITTNIQKINCLKLLFLWKILIILLFYKY